VKLEKILIGALVVLLPTPAWARSASDLQYLVHIGLAAVFWSIVIAIIQEKRGKPFTRSHFALVLMLSLFSFVFWVLFFYQ
jgi:hypothetical protein